MNSLINDNYDNVFLQFANILEQQQVQASLFSVPASMNDV
jgi:hypothetical protein